MVKMIDNYTLLQIIGQGNYGKVYKAKNVKNNNDYAIKIIPTEKLHQNNKLQQCTMNQIQTLTTIGKTDNIIMYYQMLKTKNNYYFVYQFCDGGTLQDKLQKQHHFQEDNALDIFKQLLEAFKVLNKLNIMHRDLKPQNIFFKDDRIKLGDFGFCKGLRPEENLTKTMLGSPIYMAPQVLKGQSYSTKADIWSLGVILYQMLYGVCPFQSNSIAMLIDTINFKQIALPSNIPVSQRSQRLVKKLLTKDYFRRIGWIELFSWFSQNAVDQKQNLFKSSQRNSSLDKRNSPKPNYAQQWDSKKRIMDLNFKQRSVSQDIKQDKNRFEIGSLDNITPYAFQQKNTPYTPKVEGQKAQIQDQMSNSVQDTQFIAEHKSYSAIKPGNNGGVYQAFNSTRKPVSVPKRDSQSVSIANYGHHSGLRTEDAGKKKFYSQNYQNIFSTPIVEKTSKNQDRSFGATLQNQKKNQDLIQQSERINQRPKQRTSLLSKNSIVNKSNTTTNQLKQIKSQIQQSSNNMIKVKRKILLKAHEQCMNIIQETYRNLQQKRHQYLAISYLIMQKAFQRLKQITFSVNTNEIDLLDIASLINYESIQVDRMVIDIKDQLDTIQQNVPVLEQYLTALIDSEPYFDVQVPQNVKMFLNNKLEYQKLSEQFQLLQQNNFNQNISIVNMLQQTKSQDSNNNDITTGLDKSQDTNSNSYLKYKKSQYHTTNGFSEYYKNFLQKNSNSGSQIGIK